MRIASVVIALLVCTTAGVRAQQAEPEPQESVARFWALLESETRPEQVNAVPAPPQLDDPIAESLRLVRQYELNPDRTLAYEARWDLQRALARNPNSAAHHLALALMLRRGPDANVRIDTTEHTFIDPRSLASRHTLRSLRRALELDPQLELAAVELARFAIDRHEPGLVDEADSVLATQKRSPEVLLQRARIALEKQNTTDALAHATAAAQAGADMSRVAHLRAIALLLEPATEAMGAAAYVAGLENASAAGLQEYHASAAMTFTLAETAAWDTIPVEQRADWLRERWEIRSALAGVSLAERLGVHYRRLYTAYREFPLYAPFRMSAAMGGMAVLLGEDPRRFNMAPPGLMLTRFGEADRLRWAGICGDSVPYVSLPKDTLSMVHPLDEFVPGGIYVALNMEELAAYPDQIELRQLDCQNTTQFRQFVQAWIEGERYEPEFGDVVEAQTELYAFRAPDGADVIAGLTLRARDLARIADAAGSVRLNTAVAFVDTAARATSRAERIIQFQLPTGDATHVPLAATVHTSLHGTFDTRVTLHDDPRRMGVVLGLEHEVPDFSGDALQISDVVIAPESGGARIRRGDIEIDIAAGRRYAQGESFELYYEIYGLDDDEAYRTRIVVAPARSTIGRIADWLTRTNRDAIALEFDDRASRPHDVFGVQQLRTVGTGTLPGGTYRLVVEIENVETGERVRRERLVDVEG